MRFIKTSITAACLAALVTIAGADDKTANAKLSTDEQAMLAHEHAVNQEEITMGKLAERTSASTEVKDFGKTLVTDHQKADSDLMALAKKHNAVVGKDMPKTDTDKQAAKDDQQMMMKLKTLKGADFDRQFLQMMVSGHERELAKIDTYIGQANDADLKGMLENVKPVLQKHEDKARDLAKNAQVSSK